PKNPRRHGAPVLLAEKYTECMWWALREGGPVARQGVGDSGMTTLALVDRATRTGEQRSPHHTRSAVPTRRKNPPVSVRRWDGAGGSGRRHEGEGTTPGRRRWRSGAASR